MERIPDIAALIRATLALVKKRESLPFGVLAESVNVKCGIAGISVDATSRSVATGKRITRTPLLVAGMTV